jgi:hypothetical protein
MIVSINQPAYLPWPGYFDRIAASDVHIVLDHVQFEKNSFVNRNKIRAPKAWTWLTVPVNTSGKFGALSIRDLAVTAPDQWPKKHLNALRANYARAPFFGNHRSFFEDFYAAAASEALLLPTVMYFIRHTLRLMNAKVELVMSSDLAPTQSKSELVLELCRKVGANEYLSGPLGRDYLDLERFRAAGIGVKFHGYDPAPYEQHWQGFEPGLSLVDLMMNIDPAQIEDHIAKGRRLSDA